MVYQSIYVSIGVVTIESILTIIAIPIVAKILRFIYDPSSLGVKKRSKPLNKGIRYSLLLVCAATFLDCVVNLIMNIVDCLLFIPLGCGPWAIPVLFIAAQVSLSLSTSPSPLSLSLSPPLSLSIFCVCRGVRFGMFLLARAPFFIFV